MSFIDAYAYSNHLRRVTPALKAGLTVVILSLCLVLRSPYVGVMAVLWMAGLAIGLGGISLRVFWQILLAEGVFFFLATVGIAVSVSVGPPPTAYLLLLSVGPVWLSTTPQALHEALLVISRVMGSAAAMNFLALTTPMTDLIALARRIRIPATLIDLMTIMYRYIFILSETMERMLKAQQGRLGYTNFKSGITSAGLLATRLFLETYQRSQQLQIVLEARGYESGDLRILSESYCFNGKLVFFGLAAAVSLVLAWIIG